MASGNARAILKKGEQPQLSAKWWKASQPKGLGSAGKLELALKAHEMAAVRFEKKKDPDGLKSALDTLESVEDTVQKVVAEAKKAKGNTDMEFTVQALQKLDFKKVAKTLEAEVKPEDKDDEDDDETGDDELKDPKLFGAVLRKALRRVRRDPVNWGFVMGKKPTDHRLLLHRSKNGRAIAVAAAKVLSRPPKVSYGTAVRSAEASGTLILTVNGALLPSLATRIERMLAKMKPQTANRVVLMVDGKIVSETKDPADEDEDEADDDSD